MTHTDIIILGMGIGGFETFVRLRKLLRRVGLKKTITIVDQNPYFIYTPLLHEVATGSVLPNHASFPLEKTTGDHDTFIQGKVAHIDPEKKIVRIGDNTISFDYCVVALGSTIQYYNIPHAEKHTYHVRTLQAATHLKQHLYETIERKKTINIIVVGGGPTGVEVAGQFAYIKKREKDKQVTITVIQSAPTLLPAYDLQMQQLAEKKLRKKGVNVLFGSSVQAVDDSSVTLENGTKIPSDITVWTAGFQNVGVCYLDDKFCLKERIVVDDHLTIPDHSSIYALGDIALAKDPKTGELYPQMAQVADVEADYVARHLVRTIRGKKNRPFGFRSRGDLIPIGAWDGIGQIAGITFTGPFAWWLRRTIHVLFMPGLAHKLKIIWHWTWYRWNPECHKK